MRPTDEVAWRWAVALSQPLVTDAFRRDVTLELAETCRNDPSWAARFFGGYAGELAETLPVGDRWRTLSARLKDSTVGKTPPADEGACWPDGRPFGTWRDAGDVTPRFTKYTEDDQYLSPVAVDATPRTAAMVAVAISGGWRKTPDTYAQSLPSDTKAVDNWVSDAVDSVRWILFRRQCWGVPSQDPFVCETAARWGRSELPSDDEILEALEVEKQLLGIETQSSPQSP